MITAMHCRVNVIIIYSRNVERNFAVNACTISFLPRRHNLCEIVTSNGNNMNISVFVGLSDPFVLIELSPHHVFLRQNVQQTQIVKNSLNPTFDESFEL